MKTGVLMIAALAAMVPLGWQDPSPRPAGAPGAPGFEIINQTAFDRLFAGDAAVRKLASGFKFAEGPVWMPGSGASGYLIFSDVPANEMKRWDATDGVRTFRAPAAPPMAIRVTGTVDC